MRNLALVLGSVFVLVSAAGCGDDDTPPPSTTDAGRRDGGSTPIDGATLDAPGALDAPATDDAPAPTDGCVRPEISLTDIGRDCEADMMCAEGYTCHEFSGVRLSFSCAILCTNDCDCPAMTTCEMRSDKAGSWLECARR